MTDSVHECVFVGSLGQEEEAAGGGGSGWLLYQGGLGCGCVGMDTGSPGPLRLD